MTAAPTGGHCDVRRGTPADAVVFSALHASCFPKRWEIAEMGTFLAAKECCCLLAGCRDDPSPQGMLIARRIGEEAELLTIGVSPPNRGKGVARALMAACRADLHAQGVETLFLEVDVNNLAARTLYLSLGALPVGRRKEYYGHGADADIFSLALRAAAEEDAPRRSDSRHGQASQE